MNEHEIPDIHKKCTIDICYNRMNQFNNFHLMNLCRDYCIDWSVLTIWLKSGLLYLGTPIFLIQSHKVNVFFIRPNESKTYILKLSFSLHQNIILYTFQHLPIGQELYFNGHFSNRMLGHKCKNILQFARKLYLFLLVENNYW